MRPKVLTGLLLILLVSILPVFGHLSELQIQLWDEGRLAVNSFEMSQSHNWIVTTFRGDPDMWNTKPPLLIWMQAIAINVLGTSELAVRLPSAIAATLTFLLIYWFFAVKLRKIWAGVLACIILAASTSYVRLHGIRTGDYDAMVTFFTTGYILLYYLSLEEKRRKYLLFTAVFLSLACLTKGIQTLIFTPALLLFTMYKKQIKYVLSNRGFYIGLVVFILLVPGYYLLREHYNPGYIDAVINNEITGRYMNIIENHVEEGWFYLFFLNERDSLWLVLALCSVNIGFLTGNNIIKSFTGYIFTCAAFYLLVISFGQTKLDWYTLPVVPLISILAGIFIYYVLKVSVRQVLAVKPQLYLIPLFTFGIIFLLEYAKVVKPVMKPERRLWEHTANVSTYLQRAFNGQYDIDSLVFLEDEFSQDILWYTDIMKKEKHLQYKKVHDLQPGDKVILHTDNINTIVNSNYDLSVIENRYPIIIYKINEREDNCITYK